MLAHCVPFPAPGPPSTNTTFGFTPGADWVDSGAGAYLGIFASASGDAVFGSGGSCAGAGAGAAGVVTGAAAAGACFDAPQPMTNRPERQGDGGHGSGPETTR
eukprot:1082952-Rhodomonas_salina.2